jgi:hypothetical protein
MAVLPTPGPRFPDFLCIGAQKAGTTWLDANLRRHPGIWMPWIKELQYFNDVHIPAHRAWTGRHRLAHGAKAAARVQRWAAAAGAGSDAVDRIQAMWGEPVSDDWYGRIFAHARPDQLCGEVTPEYSLLPPEGIAHVRRLNPRMKIIFLMRDPVERCWSHLRMLAKGREDFDYLAAARNPEVLARADYPAIVRRWSDVFGRSNLHLVLFQHIETEPTSVLREVCRFLGLATADAVTKHSASVVFRGQERPIPVDVATILHERIAVMFGQLDEFDSRSKYYLL